jgi:hypothetical protein
MTSQTHASKPTGLLALLASLPALPPSPISSRPPSVRQSAPQSFSAVISKALTATSAEPSVPPVGNSNDTEPSQKTASPDAANADPLALLLAMFAPPLPIAPPPPERIKSATPKGSVEATKTLVSDRASSLSATSEIKVAKTTVKTQNPTDRNLLALADESPPPSAARTAPVNRTLPAHAQLSNDGATTPSSPSRSAPGVSQAPKTDSDRGVDSAASALRAIPKANLTPTGTSVAINGQSMNLNAKRDEFAGRTEQKLPPADPSVVLASAVTAASAVQTNGGSSQRKGKSAVDLSWHHSPAQDLLISDPSAKAVSGTQQTASSPAISTNASAIGQAARIEQMITHEAMSIRDNGAATVGVSLKVDANTQLFLQLTNHNGQLQASLRCERGDFSALDSQWTQLQQALARQNVQLLPSGGNSASSFQPPPDNPRRQSAPHGGPALTTGASVEAAQPPKPKQRIRSRQNWESWA